MLQSPLLCFRAVFQSAKHPKARSQAVTSMVQKVSGSPKPISTLAKLAALQAPRRDYDGASQTCDRKRNAKRPLAQRYTSQVIAQHVLSLYDRGKS